MVKSSLKNGGSTFRKLFMKLNAIQKNAVKISEGTQEIFAKDP